MEKVIRRTALARNQAKRKVIRSEKARDKTAHKRFVQQSIIYNNVFEGYNKAARQARQEDWLRGPLAPRRDVGDATYTFGALPMDIVNGVPRPKRLRAEYVNFAQGDRVCCIRGKDKGAIGEVLSVDEKAETVQVAGMNEVCLFVCSLDRSPVFDQVKSSLSLTIKYNRAMSTSPNGTQNYKTDPQNRPSGRFRSLSMMSASSSPSTRATEKTGKSLPNTSTADRPSSTANGAPPCPDTPAT